MITMKTLFVCLIIIAAAAAAAPRIYGGKLTNITEVPWQAQVNWWIWDFVFECGAAIIGANVALTAAHCLETRQVKMVSDSTKVDFGNWHDVIKIKRHPDFVDHYPNYTYENDIAIDWVYQPFVNGTFNIARAINISTEEPSPGDQALVSGYGYGGDNNTDLLHSLVVPIIDRQECNETYNGTIGPDKICGGLLQAGKGVCRTDDGGPVVVNGALAGIVSSWNACGDNPGAPEIYTNVVYFKDWIEEQLQLFEKEQKSGKM